MYLIIGILFALCALFFFVYFYKRKDCIQKVCCMTDCQKQELLYHLAQPFGFSYLPSQDIMTSRLDAWQKDFGYCSLYDKTALHFHMVFDCEPIYFHYDNQTWLIELWKGQYGLSLGIEAGIYQTDKMVSPEQYDNTTFRGVSNADLLPISIAVNFKGQHLFSACQTHWWLTGFRVGSFCEPEDLTMDISLTFPNENMLQCFVDSLLRLGYRKCDLYICRMTVSFSFSTPHTKQPRFLCRWSTQALQWQNRILCKLYRFLTRPFTCTVDRILFLYFFLPFMFRHIFYFRKNRRQKLSAKYRKNRQQK